MHRLSKATHRRATTANSLPARDSDIDASTPPDDDEAGSLHLDPPTVYRYAVAIVALGLLVLGLPVVARLPMEPFLLLLVYGVYIGGAVVVARRSGPGGVQRLFSGALCWRIGWRKWAFAAGALPLATVAIAVLTGTYSAPADGVPVTVGNYLFLTFVFGALIVNVLEETAWQGLVQRNLTRFHGPIKAAVLASVPFAIVHLPLSFYGDPTMSEAAVATALLFAFAPAMRYLMGRLDVLTGGSLLAVGVMHASFNATGQLGVTGEWQPIAALVAVAGLAFASERRGRTSHVADEASRS